jgi:hypothetical protein
MGILPVVSKQSRASTLPQDPASTAVATAAAMSRTTTTSSPSASRFDRKKISRVGGWLCRVRVLCGVENFLWVGGCQVDCGELISFGSLEEFVCVRDVSVDPVNAQLYFL